MAAGPISVVRLVHGVAPLWVLGMLLLAARAPALYYDLVQEDQFIEWGTVGLFAIAGILMLARAWRTRMPFDALVALFCLFVAGEEFSWGQRLFGFTPPEVFLEHNAQQELTLHNFAALFGRPRMPLIAALLGYGVVLVGVSRIRPGARLLARIGATAPPLALGIWFAAAAALLIWYPVEFTGEWVEALAGGLFLASATDRLPTLLSGTAGAAMAAILLTFASARPGRATSSQIACAEREVRALLQDVTDGGAARPRLHRMRSVHKRIWTAFRDGYLDPDRLTSFAQTRCETDDHAGLARRRTVVDPWGLPYWLRVQRLDDGTHRVTVYSMGPNRRRDALGDDDDIVTRGILRADTTLARVGSDGSPAAPDPD